MFQVNNIFWLAYTCLETATLGLAQVDGDRANLNKLQVKGMDAMCRLFEHSDFLKRLFTQ